MRQADLDRAVAHATGESVATVKRFGFILDEPFPESDDLDDFGPHVIDWDEIESQRYAAVSGEQHHAPTFA
jgi:hypothetical protein